MTYRSLLKSYKDSEGNNLLHIMAKAFFFTFNARGCHRSIPRNNSILLDTELLAEKYQGKEGLFDDLKKQENNEGKLPYQIIEEYMKEQNLTSLDNEAGRLLEKLKKVIGD